METDRVLMETHGTQEPFKSNETQFRLLLQHSCQMTPGCNHLWVSLISISGNANERE